MSESCLATSGAVVLTTESHLGTWCNELDRLGDPTFHRDGFSDSIFGCVVFDNLTKVCRHAQLHLCRRVTAGTPNISSSLPVVLLSVETLDIASIAAFQATIDDHDGGSEARNSPLSSVNVVGLPGTI